MNSQLRIFEAADFFLTRSSLLAEGQKDASSEFLFDFYKKTPLFQEAIAVASPSLFESLKKGFREKKHYQSLLKYYLRMSSRATPFGLFSAVGWGKFAEKGSLTFSTSSIKKKARVDMAWGQAFIDYIHSHKEIVRCLKMMTNPSLMKRAGRFLISKENDTLSIKSSVVSNYIFDLAKTHIVYSDLEEKLIERFAEHSPEIVSDYLWQVFQKGYLLSSCSISLNHPVSLKDFYTLLKGKKTLLQNQNDTLNNFGIDLPILNRLNSLLENYEQAPIGEGLCTLEELLSDLIQCKKFPYPVQIDAYSDNENFSLPMCVKQSVEETVSFLWLLSNEETYNFSDYYHHFQEKYGENRLVPLLELIDPQQGLGVFKPNVKRESKSSSFSWHQLLLSAMKDNEIQLQHLPEIEVDQEKLKKAPGSLEISFELLATSEEELNAGNFTLIINPLLASKQAGAIFGRFLYLFDITQTDQLRKLLKQEEDLYPQVLFVEAGFSPSHSRNANVAFHENVRDFQLQMHFHEPSDRTLELEDIYVGSRKSKLYLFSKKHQKELHIVLSSAINSELAPPVLNFLLDLSQQRFTSFNPSIWGKKPPSNFLPRVSYKNVVLSSAQWLLKPSDLKVTDKSSLSEIEQAIRNTLFSLNIPCDVYLVHFDNRLLVDWKNPDHFSLIMQHFIRKQEILLVEFIGKKQQNLVHSEMGRHVSEFVVPCIKKKGYEVKDSQFHYPHTEQVNPLDRLSLPGGEWLYVKLFVAKNDEESFLLTQISFFIQHLLDNHLIDQWFYVRYQEEKSHIRLRIHGSPQKLNAIVIPLLHSYCCQWISQGLLAHFCFDIYEREVERYGGPKGIFLAEEVFCADTLITMSLLKQKNHLKLPLHVLGAIGVINILKGFYTTIDDQLRCISSLSEKHFLSGFREHTPMAVEITLNLLYENQPTLTDGFLAEWQEQLKALRRLLEPFEQQISTSQWNQKNSIILSIVHMHCNRLFGIDPEKEKAAITIATHLLEKIKYKLKARLCNIFELTC